MNIGIIGFGHLGQSLVKGLLLNNFISKNNIYITAKSDETKSIAIKNYSINICNSNNELIEKTDIIFISIPSKAFLEFANLKIENCENKFFVSLMAGVTINKIKYILGNINIIRAMPNLGIEKCNGIICYTNTTNTYIINLFNHLGFAFAVEETDIEKVTAFASCGVGFAAYILDCFYKAGKKIGFSSDISIKIVSNIFSNAISSDDYNSLVLAVATKGGATEAGLNSLTDDRLNDIIFNAIENAYIKIK